MKLILGLKQQIESIIGTALDEYEITVHEWNQSAMQLTGWEQDQSGLLGVKAPEDGKPNQEFASDAIANVKSLNTEERIYFKVKFNENKGTLVCWGCSAGSITMETRRLIELLITNSADRLTEELPVIYENNREQELAELGKWLRRRQSTPRSRIPFRSSFQFEMRCNLKRSRFCCNVRHQTPIVFVRRN